LCCWSDIHCIMCELPGILCECVSCGESDLNRAVKEYEATVQPRHWSWSSARVPIDCAIFSNRRSFKPKQR
jgi:hypothetical protein